MRDFADLCGLVRRNAIRRGPSPILKGHNQNFNLSKAESTIP